MPKPTKTTHTSVADIIVTKPLEIFVPITKIDSAKRLVYGVFTQETPDKSNEVLDYASGKKAFQEWSDEIHKASNGKSKGNVREMHDKRAVGRVEELKFDDENKKVLGVVKVVDDAAWEKVQEGVLNGFSIGGGYARRWTDPADGRGVTRYTPTLSEVSLVDNPCLAEATFDFVKADGLTEKRTVRRPTSTTNKENTDMSKNKTNVTPTAKQVWEAADGSTHDTKVLADAASAAHLAKNAASGVLAALDKAAVSVAGLPSLIDGGDGLPDTARGETPENKDGVLHGGMHSSHGGPTDQSHNAGYAKADGAEGGEADKVDDKAKEGEGAEKGDGGTMALGAGDGYPKPVGTAAESHNGHYGKAEKAEKAKRMDKLRKNLHDAGRLAHLLQDMAWLKDCLAMEAKMEGDGSKVPEEIESIMRAMGQALESLVTEEVGELFEEGEEDEATEVIILELAAKPEGFKKFVDGKVTKATPKENGLYKLSDALEKAGKRHSKSDQERVQMMHDTAHDMHKVAEKCFGHMEHMVKCAGMVKNTAVDLGANGEKLPAFDGADSHHTSAADKAAGGDLQKMTSERDALTKVFQEVTPRVEKLAGTVETLLKDKAELEARLKKIEDQPLPAKGTVAGARTLTKSQDGADGIDPAALNKSIEQTIADMTPEQRSLLLVKAAKMNPSNK
jgi:hypothetical protein